MPNIPQHIQLPHNDRIITDIEGQLNVKVLSRLVHAGFHAIARWVQTAGHVINAQTKTDTYAKRTTNPLDESFYVADDTHQVFTAVDGAWKSVGPRRLISTVASGAASFTASFIGGSHASLVPWALPSWDTTVFVDSVAASQISFDFGTAAANGGTLYWGVFDEW